MSTYTYTQADSETLRDEHGNEYPLNKVMEFGCPIRVHGDGMVTFLPDDAPTEPDAHEEAGRLDWNETAWEPLTGFTGQYSYNGPVMHPSEYIGGRLARYILDTPGLYVAVVVDALDEDGEMDEEPAGWAVFTIRDETWEG